MTVTLNCLKIYSIILFGCIITYSSCSSKSPIIYLENEYVIDTNDNITIRCEGTEPVIWKYPNNSINDVIWSWVHIKTSQIPEKEDYKFVVLLSLYNASFVDTGFYYCHAEGLTDFVDEARASKIYLYVKDIDHLSTFTNELETVTVVQNNEAVLPCRPTSPDVNVKLYKNDDEEVPFRNKVHLNEQDDDGVFFLFDPKVGFIINGAHVKEPIVSREDYYVCYFSHNHIYENITVILLIQPETDSIAKPELQDYGEGHTVIGDTLILTCTIKCSVQFTMDWIVPDQTGNSTGRINISPIRAIATGIFDETLTIQNVTLKDQGNYTCFVKDINKNVNNNTKSIKIYNRGEHFIHLSEDNDVYYISKSAGEQYVQWRINVDAHPVNNLELTWFDNKNNPIIETDSKSKKYIFKFTTTEAIIKILDVNINDYGNYTLVVKNDFTTESLKLFLNVTDKPTVHIESSDYHLINEVSEIKCKVAGYPEPTISWKFKACLDNGCDFHSLNETREEKTGLQVISYINIRANKSGYISCVGTNVLGSDNVTIGYYVTEVANGFNVWTDAIINDDQTSQQQQQHIVAVGDDFELNCAVSVYNYTNHINWYKYADSNYIKHDHERYIIQRGTTEFSYKMLLTIKNASLQDSGDYVCRVEEISSNNQTFKEANITIEIAAPTMPAIINSNANRIDMLLPDEVQLECFVTGLPKPNVVWYKDKEKFIVNNRSQIIKDGQILKFKRTDEMDEGIYSCFAQNKLGKAHKQIELKFGNIRGILATKYIVLIALLTALLTVCVIILLIKCRREKTLNAELKKVGLVNFEKGAVDSLNPELGVDDQAELLPYDKKFEFPRDKLKLGKQLGAGAFGVVMKAEGYGILPEEECSTVAVKMVKRNADNTYIRALASELKIMVHLGKHLNVVNLLGACTKNVAKRELLVIVEYCRFGNLQNYLLRHRDNFVDQIDVAGFLDFTILYGDGFERSFSTSTNRSNSNTFQYPPNLKYADLSFAPNSKDEGHINNAMADYRDYTGKTTYTDVTTISNMSPTSKGPTNIRPAVSTTGQSDDLIMSSNNSSVQPEWRSNYRGDYKAGNVQPICTKDLLSWSFQTARAMEYLASRKVLHGDLAARNILLADNNIVKICDFGLAKSMYKNDNYKKKGDGPLPVKWMAVESIRDRVFSTQSDVWSFGIVLWELFSLAKTPYPGMEADERLYHKLINGYRMEKPKYATKEIYRLMMDCWEAKPPIRPTFTRLVDRIGYMLDESVKQHYIDLNDPYLVMNTHRLDDGQSDYLAMFTPPDFENLASPQNYHNAQNQATNGGYMIMKPGQIFSPREPPPTEASLQTSVFNFDLNKKRDRLDSESALGTELLPILHTRGESCNSPTPSSPSNTPPAQSPPYDPITSETTIPIDSFSNPSYLMLPKTSTILQSNDNYINLPKHNKSAVQQHKNYINEPSEVSYVNNTSRDWERIN